MLLHWSKNWQSIPTCTSDEDDVDEVEDCNTSGMPFQQLSFLLQSVELADVPPDNFLPPSELLVLVS